MKLWHKFKPTRDAHEGVEVVADLDALVSEEVAFRFQGKTYYLRPLTAGEAFVAWQNLANLEEFKKRENVTFKDVLDFYSEMFKSVCPEITREDVAEMTQPQCAALLQLILDTITGRVFTESKKKVNHMREQWEASTLPS